MDTLGALALATEPTDNLMKRHPVGRREPLVTNVMWRNLFIQALYQIAVLLIFNFDGKRILRLQNESWEHAEKIKNTFVFNAFVFCQIFNEFDARKPEEKNVFEGVTNNHLFMAIVGATAVLQILIIEFLGEFFDTARLNWRLWLLSMAIGAVSWPLAYVGKFIPCLPGLSRATSSIVLVVEDHAKTKSKAARAETWQVRPQVRCSTADQRAFNEDAAHLPGVCLSSVF